MQCHLQRNTQAGGHRSKRPELTHKGEAGQGETVKDNLLRGMKCCPNIGLTSVKDWTQAGASLSFAELCTERDRSGGMALLGHASYPPSDSCVNM